MAHIHSVYDTDKHFVIDPVARTVTNVSGKVVVVQGDHNSERLTFEIPRTVEGHDMSTCNKVEVHYNNVDAANPSIPHPNAYEVDDLQLSPDDENVVILSWLISADATRYVGQLHFSIKFMCDDGDGKPDYVWKTATHKSVSVVAAQDSGETIATECEDMLKTIEDRVTENVSAGVVDNLNEAMDEYAEEWDAKLDVERVRIDEMVAQRGDDTVTVFEITADDGNLTGVIKSNGVSAHIELTLRNNMFDATNRSREWSVIIPSGFMPSGRIALSATNSVGNDFIVLVFPYNEGVKIQFNYLGNETAVLYPSDVFVGVYSLSEQAIAELSDIRVDYNGIVHKSAGAAVRDNINTLNVKFHDMNTKFGKEIADLKKNGGGGGGITITDDGNGNVEIVAFGGVSITDDGNGNVVMM